MYRSVLSVMKSKQSVWNNIPRIVDSVEELESGIAQIEALEQQRMFITAGITTQREMKYEQLYFHMKTLQDAFWILANATSDYSLLERYSRSGTFFRHLNVSDRIVWIDQMEKDINTYGVQLADFGVTDDQLLLFLSLAEEYKGLRTIIRDRIVDRKSLGTEIERLDRRLKILLNGDLDRMIRVYTSLSNGDFMLRYFNARVIVDHHSKKGAQELPSEPDDGGSGE